METITQEYARLRDSVLACLTGHDLVGVMDHGAAENEYAPEAEDFARRIVEGTPVTPELVAAVWHHWFGDPSDEPQLTSAVEAMAAGLQAIQDAYGENPLP
jgi:hypothetical protein